jgi:hypothetical protein
MGKLENNEMVTDEQIQEVVRLVESSFENRPYPGDDNIGVHDIEEGFMGKRWKDITHQLLWNHRDEIGSLTPDAFRYYLPAFLLAVLQSSEKLDAFPIIFIPYLIPPVSISHDKYVKKEQIFIALDSLTAEQKRTVGICLNMIAELYPGDKWSTFEEHRKQLAQAVEFWSQYAP